MVAVHERPVAGVMPMPTPRGPLTETLFGAWRSGRIGLPAEHSSRCEQHVRSLDTEAAVGGEDLHLALYACYELHYTGIVGVDDAWEWDPSLLAFRGVLEAAFEEGVRRVARTPDPKPARIEKALAAITGRRGGPELSTYIEQEASREQVEEFLIHRSAYTLKEADPHTWVIPRLRGAPKAAMVEVQSDEYGGGDPAWVHARLFADSMRAMGLDATPGAYVDRLPGSTLATVNLMSLFGLHRRLRGAAVGHLAAFEMTSCIPNARYAAGLRRLGAPPAATVYFDEHVEADAVHGSLAAHDLAAGLIQDEPGLDRDVRFGAEALLALEERAGGAMLAAWQDGRSSLLPEAGSSVAA